jgi:hypothetical protein
MILGVVAASNRWTLFCLDMFVSVELFYSPIERRTQAEGRIGAALGEPVG